MAEHRRSYAGVVVAVIAAFAPSSRTAAEDDLWSLRPIQAWKQPELHPAHRRRARTPIDSFVMARLASGGLDLSPPAERATYLRRVTLDLTGLLPTTAEVGDFVRDSRKDACERAVDRLLASPHYGERWGRHWLDVVRYAESNGFERNKLRSNFWRYRDYVIDSFNRDKPYDQFVREQLAGDAIKPGNPEHLIATGFLVAGPKNDVKTDSELQRMKRRQDEIDEFVRVTSTTLFGLTVGCGRCHDHKYDPISSRDYYGLAAVFSGLDRLDKVVASQEEKERYAVRFAAAQRKVDTKNAELEKALEPARKRLVVNRLMDLAKGKVRPAVAFERNEDPLDPVYATHVRIVITATSGNAKPCLDELEVYGADRNQNLALVSAGARASASSVVPNNDFHQIHHLNDGMYGNARSWVSNEQGTGQASIDLGGRKRVQLVVWGRDRTGTYKDRLAVRYRIEVSDDTAGQGWTTVSSSEVRAPFHNDETIRKVRKNVSEQDVVAVMTTGERSRYQTLRAELLRFEEEIKKLPPLANSYVVHDQPPQSTFVLDGGDVRARGQMVGPRALAAVKSLDPNLLPQGEDSGPRRRLLLAHWMVDPKNPLLSRVFVNRVWQYHFGAGIVTTPNDFGFNGDRPSHPELLDWLAADFMRHSWSMKQLHRRIVLSAVYRQGSRYDSKAAARDGANRLLWRVMPRRLEAETIRDTILQVSGQLDVALGGPSFRLFRYVDGNVPEYVLLEDPGHETWRRAVYMYNIHTFDSPLMRAFDCADAMLQVPRRVHSVTALQALSLMNNRFVFEQARFFARRVTVAAGSRPEDQAVEAYRIALLREPTVKERQAASEFVREHGLLSLCRVLLNTNEFLYVF
ncbi:MAG: DUF1549 and DUF1553 domain-containing protein [Planctomycetota bacterium]|nr:DUF1549 and DUF1553 domain-containing protein [Planctomycetota bacterium]